MKNVSCSLLPLLALGFSCRIAFSFYFSTFYFGSISFRFGDSFSYSEPFLNLLNFGHYTFEIGNTDAYMYRGPAYPFFWGIHYLLFGSNLVYQAIAVSQSLLDTLTAFLIFLILRHLNVPLIVSFLSCALYLFHPIFIVHVPITGTETFATFLTIFIIYLALTKSKARCWLLFIGFLLGMAVLTRQYLGLLLAVFLIYIFLQLEEKSRLKDYLRNAAIVILGFGICIGPWYGRNLINHNTNSFLMGATTGYSSYQEDWLALKDFYSLYFVNITPVRDGIAETGVNGLAENDLPYVSFEKVQAADYLAYKCGPSFLSWRGADGYSQTQTSNLPNCKASVVQAYRQLYIEALSNAPIFFKYQQPFGNLYKSVFKDSLVKSLGGWKDTIVEVMFSTRSIFVLGALFSLFILKGGAYKVFMLFPVFLIIYISFIARQVEMRYLVQADAVSVVFFALFTGAVLSKLSHIFHRIRGK